MKSFAVTTSIRAAPEKIWGILTDAPGYPTWNPTVTKVEGRIALGERLVMHVALNTGRAFPVTVSQLEPARCMIWRGGLPLGLGFFLFKGVRTFTLSPRTNGAVDFTMREEFSGLLAPLIGRAIPDLQPAFDEFAAALKREAER
jgi:hypothetical protein